MRPRLIASLYVGQFYCPVYNFDNLNFLAALLAIKWISSCNLVI